MSRKVQYKFNKFGIYLTVAAVVAVFVFTFLVSSKQTYQIKRPISYASDVIWSAGHETGDLNSVGDVGSSEWQKNQGGGEYNSGNADAAITTEMAHTGFRSAKLTISTPNNTTSGTRLFRWKEANSYRSLYYSAWVYFPVQYSLTHDPGSGQFLNLMQFKSKSMGGRNDPIWGFYLQNDGSGKFKIQVGWGWGGVTLAGPNEGNPVGGKWYSQAITSIPVGRWVHLVAYLKQSTGNTSNQTVNFDGQLKFWQDDTLLFEFNNIRTGYYNNTTYQGSSNCNPPCDSPWNTSSQWSVNNYSDGISPYPASIYVDDASISQSYEGTGVTTSPTPTAVLTATSTPIPTKTPTPTPTLRPTPTPTRIPTPIPLPTPTVLLLEGESFTGTGVIKSDLTASGRASLKYPWTGTAKAGVNISAATSKVYITAKQDYCQGNAKMTVKVDGVTVADNVEISNSTSWVDYTYTAAINPGYHQVSVAFNNDRYVSGVCDRNLYLDKVTFR